MSDVQFVLNYACYMIESTLYSFLKLIDQLLQNKLIWYIKLKQNCRPEQNKHEHRMKAKMHQATQVQVIMIHSFT